MPDPFIPFVPASFPAAAVKGGGKSAGAAAFSPVSGKNALPGLASRPGTAAAATATAQADTARCDQPKITLQREGDRVVKICIDCSCGQHLVLDCAY